MYSLKGFIRIESLVKNAVGQSSIVGELSTLAMTYSKEKGEYTLPSTPDLSLVAISSIDATGKVPVPPDIATQTLNVAKFVFDYASAKAGNIKRADFEADVLAHFSGSMSKLNFGEFISNGNLSLPSFISWTNQALAENIIKVWFSDNTFRQQYDLFEIVVIAPLANIDDFYLPVNLIKDKLRARTFPILQDLLQAAKQGNPETATRSSAYDYCNPLTGVPTVSAVWSVLIYGLAGDNVDSIKDALVAYILANSTHTRAEWSAIFPDIFKRTEFIILPRWENYAIPNLTVSPGIYSPVVNLREAFTYAKARVPDYAAAHIDKFLTVFGLTYKSLAVLCISNPDNRNAKLSITDVFADYIDESTLSIDFNRQDINTQLFSSLLERLVIAAESTNDFNDIPPDMRKVKRGPIIYISSIYQNIQYLVATKLSSSAVPLVLLPTDPAAPKPTPVITQPVSTAPGDLLLQPSWLNVEW